MRGILVFRNIRLRRCYRHYQYTGVPGGKVNILGGHTTRHSKQNFMCPLIIGFRDKAISLCSSKIADNKDILSTVSNIGIYCSSDKVDTVYLV
jgi:hypothetical protein